MAKKNVKSKATAKAGKPSSRSAAKATPIQKGGKSQLVEPQVVSPASQGRAPDGSALPKGRDDVPINNMPQVPFGAVYFRKSNPPREDWERHYAVAAEDGLNIFRHWFMWSAVERKPGVFDWDDYDRTKRAERRASVLVTPTRIYTNPG